MSLIFKEVVREIRSFECSGSSPRYPCLGQVSAFGGPLYKRPSSSRQTISCLENSTEIFRKPKLGLIATASRIRETTMMEASQGPIRVAWKSEPTT